MAIDMALIVMSHGDFAKGAMQSAELILGAQENYKVVTLTPSQGRADILEAMRKASSELDTSRGLILMVDFKGGTTSSIAGEIVLTQDDTYAFCGFSLPILLECLANREEEIDVIEACIFERHKTSFCNLGDLLKSEYSEGGDEDGY